MSASFEGVALRPCPNADGSITYRVPGSAATGDYTRTIREDVHTGKLAPGKIERRGKEIIIRDVRVLGERSRNAPPRRNVYPLSTRAKAIRFLEGIAVMIDHGRQAGEPRSYKDRCGVLENVYEAGDCLRADWRFPAAHPNAEQIAWDAANKPDFGMSINATAKKIRREGQDSIVEEWEEIHSVDCVSKPATSDGLFEHRTADTQTPERNDNAMSMPDPNDGRALAVWCTKPFPEKGVPYSVREARRRAVARGQHVHEADEYPSDSAVADDRGAPAGGGDAAALADKIGTACLEFMSGGGATESLRRRPGAIRESRISIPESALESNAALAEWAKW